MPPASAPLAQHNIPRLERRIELKQGKWKGSSRLYVRLLDGNHVEYKVWISFTASERVADILTAMPFMLEDDLSDDFKATLCAGKRAILRRTRDSRARGSTWPHHTACLVTPTDSESATTRERAANKPEQPAAGALGSHSVPSGPNTLHPVALHARSDRVPSRLIGAARFTQESSRSRALMRMARRIIRLLR
jgi:hypothetical protein